MARENDNNVEVIDPEDRRYKDDNYFNGNFIIMNVTTIQ